MLNRKFADLRHAHDLDPRVLGYDPAGLPQSVVAIGPGARRKTKGGVIVAEPGFTWAISCFRGRWYTITSIYDARRLLVAHHVDLCVPPEERDGLPSFLDLKLDVLVRPEGEWSWLDQDEYDEEVATGTIPKPWQDAVAALDRGLRAGTFPPSAVAQFRPAEPPPAHRANDLLRQNECALVAKEALAVTEDGNVLVADCGP